MKMKNLGVVSVVVSQLEVSDLSVIVEVIGQQIRFS